MAEEFGPRHEPSQALFTMSTVRMCDIVRECPISAVRSINRSHSDSQGQTETDKQTDTEREREKQRETDGLGVSLFISPNSIRRCRLDWSQYPLAMPLDVADSISLIFRLQCH